MKKGINTYIELEDCMEITDYKGISFYIDKEDFENVKQYTWNVSMKNKEINTKINNKTVYLWQILFTYDEVIDHIDRNKLNNRRTNFRKCSQLNNSKNQSKPKNSNCKFMGVSIEHGKYTSRIGHNRKKIHLGSFSTFEEAIIARLRAEKLYCGEFAPQKELFEKYGITD